MKEQKGMGHIVLIIAIIVIAFVIVTVLYFLKQDIDLKLIENYQTNMLQIQGKITIISQEATIQKNEGLLKGRKLSDYSSVSSVKKLFELGLIAMSEENYQKYYILDNLELEQLKLENIKIDKGFFVVNYDSEEVIYSEGIKLNEKTYYKLSEIKELNKKENKAEENKVEENTITNEETSTENNTEE